MEINFGGSVPYSVGVEEEFQLLDPSSFALTPAINDVLDAREGSGFSPETVGSELSASCLEMRSPVYDTVAELATELPELRRKVRDLVEGCGTRLASAGTHPFSESTEQRITGKKRYRKVEEEMGWTARMQAIYGLHIHVAVPDAERAIRAVSALARHVPLFVALSANSPFWNGADTRLASTRIKVFGLVPRSGLPPMFHTWEDFENHVDTLVRAGSVPDYTLCWWDARPHPKLGTVELRAPDVQTDAHHTASLAALAQCLVATTEDYTPEDPRLTAENKWRATRYGLDARFYDFATGQSVSARDAARSLVEELSPVSQDLGCEPEVEGVLEILEGGNGAEMQRSVFEKHGSLEAVARYLAANTA